MHAGDGFGVGLVEHVALAQQHFRTLFAQDRAAVDAAGDVEADPGRQVRLDHAGDDVDRGALRGHDQVDARRAALLRQALDQDFDFLADRDHEVGQLVDDHHHLRGFLVIELVLLVHFLAGFGIEPDLDAAAERRTLGLGGAHLVVEALEVADRQFGHHPVAALHLLDRPFERAHRLLRLGHDRGEKVRDIVVALELEHLGVDQDQAALFGREAIEQRQQDRIEADRLARTGGARDQQVRHRGEVGDDRLARNVLAQDDREGALVIDEGGILHQLLEHHRLAFGIGQFDAHHRAPRHRRHAGRDGGHVARDIVGQPDDPRGLDPRCGLELVHGHDRAGAHGGDLALHVEIVEHGFEQAGIAFERQLVEFLDAAGRRIGEQGDIGQAVAVEQVALGLGGRRLGALARGGRFLDRRRLAGRARGLVDIVLIGDTGLLPFRARRCRLVLVELAGVEARGDLPGLATEEGGDVEQRAPVDREQAGDDRRARGQRHETQRPDDPAMEGFGRQSCQRRDRARAEQAGDAATRCGQRRAAPVDHQRADRGQQHHRKKQHPDRLPARPQPAVFGRAGPQAPSEHEQQGEEQHADRADDHQREIGGPRSGGAHPVLDRAARGGGGGGIGLTIADQCEREKRHAGEEHDRAADLQRARPCGAQRLAPFALFAPPDRGRCHVP